MKSTNGSIDAEFHTFWMTIVDRAIDIFSRYERLYGKV